MRFLVDVNLGRPVSGWLQSQGHDASDLRTSGLHRLSDNEVFALAALEDRCLITLDLDFSRIAALATKPKPSIVLLRLRDTRSAYVISRLNQALRMTRESLERGSLVIVEDHRVRTRPLPIRPD